MAEGRELNKKFRTDGALNVKATALDLTNVEQLEELSTYLAEKNQFVKPFTHDDLVNLSQDEARQKFEQASQSVIVAPDEQKEEGRNWLLGMMGSLFKSVVDTGRKVPGLEWTVETGGKVLETTSKFGAATVLGTVQSFIPGEQEYERHLRETKEARGISTAPWRTIPFLSPLGVTSLDFWMNPVAVSKARIEAWNNTEGMPWGTKFAMEMVFDPINLLPFSWIGKAGRTAMAVQRIRQGGKLFVRPGVPFKVGVKGGGYKSTSFSSKRMYERASEGKFPFGGKSPEKRLARREKWLKKARKKGILAPVAATRVLDQVLNEVDPIPITTEDVVSIQHLHDMMEQYGTTSMQDMEIVLHSMIKAAKEEVNPSEADMIAGEAMDLRAAIEAGYRSDLLRTNTPLIDYPETMNRVLETSQASSFVEPKEFGHDLDLMGIEVSMPETLGETIAGVTRLHDIPEDLPLETYPMLLEGTFRPRISKAPVHSVKEVLEKADYVEPDMLPSTARALEWGEARLYRKLADEFDLESTRGPKDDFPATELLEIHGIDGIENWLSAHGMLENPLPKTSRWADVVYPKVTGKQFEIIEIDYKAAAKMMREAAEITEKGIPNRIGKIEKDYLERKEAAMAKGLKLFEEEDAYLMAPDEETQIVAQIWHGTMAPPGPTLSGLPELDPDLGLSATGFGAQGARSLPESGMVPLHVGTEKAAQDWLSGQAWAPESVTERGSRIVYSDMILHKPYGSIDNPVSDLVANEGPMRRLGNIYGDHPTPEQTIRWYQKLQQQGYDSIIYRNETEDAGSISYIVFYPEQAIKDAWTKRHAMEAVREPLEEGRPFGIGGGMPGFQRPMRLPGQHGQHADALLRALEQNDAATKLPQKVNQERSLPTGTNRKGEEGIGAYPPGTRKVTTEDGHVEYYLPNGDRADPLIGNGTDYIGPILLTKLRNAMNNLKGERPGSERAYRVASIQGLQLPYVARQYSPEGQAFRMYELSGIRVGELSRLFNAKTADGKDDWFNPIDGVLRDIYDEQNPRIHLRQVGSEGQLISEAERLITVEARDHLLNYIENVRPELLELQRWSRDGSVVKNWSDVKGKKGHLFTEKQVNDMVRAGQTRPNPVQSPDEIFIDQFGYGMTPDRAALLSRHIGDEAEKLGIRYTTSSLRHTFSQMMALAHVDHQRVASLMGHAGTENLVHYYNTADLLRMLDEGLESMPDDVTVFMKEIEEALAGENDDLPWSLVYNNRDSAKAKAQFASIVQRYHTAVAEMGTNRQGVPKASYKGPRIDPNRDKKGNYTPYGTQQRNLNRAEASLFMWYHGRPFTSHLEDVTIGRFQDWSPAAKEAYLTLSAQLHAAVSVSAFIGQADIIGMVRLDALKGMEQYDDLFKVLKEKSGRGKTAAVLNASNMHQELRPHNHESLAWFGLKKQSAEADDVGGILSPHARNTSVGYEVIDDAVFNELEKLRLQASERIGMLNTLYDSSISGKGHWGKSAQNVKRASATRPLSAIWRNGNGPIRRLLVRGVEGLGIEAQASWITTRAVPGIVDGEEVTVAWEIQRIREIRNGVIHLYSEYPTEDQLKSVADGGQGLGIHANKTQIAPDEYGEFPEWSTIGDTSVLPERIKPAGARGREEWTGAYVAEVVTGNNTGTAQQRKGGLRTKFRHPDSAGEGLGRQGTKELYGVLGIKRTKKKFGGTSLWREFITKNILVAVPVTPKVAAASKGRKQVGEIDYWEFNREVIEEGDRIDLELRYPTAAGGVGDSGITRPPVYHGPGFVPGDEANPLDIASDAGHRDAFGQGGRGGAGGGGGRGLGLPEGHDFMPDGDRFGGTAKHVTDHASDMPNSNYRKVITGWMHKNVRMPLEWGWGQVAGRTPYVAVINGHRAAVAVAKTRGAMAVDRVAYGAKKEVFDLSQDGRSKSVKLGPKIGQHPAMQAIPDTTRTGVEFQQEARRFQNILETPLPDILSKDYYDLSDVQLKWYMEFHEILARSVAMPGRIGVNIDEFLDLVEDGGKRAARPQMPSGLEILYVPRMLDMTSKKMRAKNARSVPKIGGVPGQLKDRAYKNMRDGEKTGGEVYLNDVIGGLGKLVEGLYTHVADKQFERTFAAQFGESTARMQEALDVGSRMLAAINDPLDLLKILPADYAAVAAHYRDDLTTTINNGFGRDDRARQDMVDIVQNMRRQHELEKQSVVDIRIGHEGAIEKGLENFVDINSELAEAAYRKDVVTELKNYARNLEVIDGPLMKTVGLWSSVIRTLSTTYDLGVPLIHGFMLLVMTPQIQAQKGVTMYRGIPDRGIPGTRDLKKSVLESLSWHKSPWSSAVREMMLAIIDPQRARQYRAEHADTIAEMAQAHVPFYGQELEEISGPFLGKLRGGPGPIGGATKRAEAGFNTFLDVGRIEFYEAMRPFCQTTEEINELAAATLKITGGMDAVTSGITEHQRAIESSFIMFAPMLRRATAALIWKSMEGAVLLPGAAVGKASLGMERRQALKAVGSLITAATAFGMMVHQSGNNKNVFNTSSPDFMSMKFGDSRVGMGTPYYSLMRMASDLINQLKDDPSGIGRFDLEDHALLKWGRSSLAPGPGTLVDAIHGRNFIGDPLRDPDGSWNKADIARYLGRQSFPFWIESVTFDFQGWNRLSTFGEIAGLRTSPLPRSRKIRHMQEVYIQTDTADPDLVTWRNDQYRKGAPVTLEEAPRMLVNRLDARHEDLRAMKEEMHASRLFRGKSEVVQKDDYIRALGTNREAVDTQLAGFSEQFEAGLISGRDLRKHESESAAYLRGAQKSLSNQYADVVDSLDERRQGRLTMDEGYLGDLVYDDYRARVTASPELVDEYGNFRPKAFGVMERSFENELNNQEIWDYIQARKKDNRELPQTLKELNEARELLMPYWTLYDQIWGEGSWQAELVASYWDLRTAASKDRFEAKHPRVVNLVSKLRDERLKYRRKNKDADAALVRFYDYMPVKGLFAKPGSKVPF